MITDVMSKHNYLLFLAAPSMSTSYSYKNRFFETLKTYRNFSFYFKLPRALSVLEKYSITVVARAHQMSSTIQIITLNIKMINNINNNNNT